MVQRSRYPAAYPIVAPSIATVAIAFRCRRNARDPCTVPCQWTLQSPSRSKYPEPSTKACLIIISRIWHVKPQQWLLYCLMWKLHCFAGLRVLDCLCHCDEHYNRIVTYTLQTFQLRSRKSPPSCGFINFVQIRQNFMNRVASMARACAETKANKQKNIRAAVD